MTDTDELRAAAQQALECLEQLQGGCTDSDDGTVEAITVWCPEIIDALRAALAQPATDDRWSEGFKHGQWLAKHSAPVVERADYAPPVVERGAGNLSDNAAPVAPAERASEPAAWMTHHDEPMLFPSRAEAAQYCDDDERPIALYAAPQPAPARVPLTDAQVLSAILPIAADNPTVYLALCYESGPYSVTQLRTVAVSLARAIEAAHGIAAPTAQQEPKP